MTLVVTNVVVNPLIDYLTFRLEKRIVSYLVKKVLASNMLFLEYYDKGQ